MILYYLQMNDDLESIFEKMHSEKSGGQQGNDVSIQFNSGYLDCICFLITRYNNLINVTPCRSPPRESTCPPWERMMRDMPRAPNP